MIRINQVKLPINHTKEQLWEKAAKTLKMKPEQIKQLKIIRQSLDARRKAELHYSYTLEIETEGEERVLARNKHANVMISREKPYCFPKMGAESLTHPPVIVGSGPAGLFCGLMLARHGYCPLILERGEDMDARAGKVEHFWRTGELDPISNVQFGEGGAGTFSDGKLNTLVKDPLGRNKLILEIFTEFGADPEILYQSKPHIGTDVLSQIVKAMREEILSLGGQIRFCSQVTDLLVKDGRLTGVKVNEKEMIQTDVVVLAIGHSARDTFEMLHRRQIPMEGKAFAVGLRIQHPQQMINLSQYGLEEPGILGAASYKLTNQTSSGRGVYTFCMCPGGYVVNASSEPEQMAVNGMSYHARAGVNANSAVIVTVTPEDFPERGPLGGVAFQRCLEKLAYASAKGRIPIQLYGDFKENRVRERFGDVETQVKGAFGFANLREILPPELSAALIEGIDAFGCRIRGFDRPDAILAGVESRTSSPVRIHRGGDLESETKGLFPCGEGAGYAGGITSAAMDGVKVAEEIRRRYQPPSRSICKSW